MAVASGPAGLVLAGPVFMVIFGTEHAQKMNFHTCAAALSNNMCLYHTMAIAVSNWQYH